MGRVTEREYCIRSFRDEFYAGVQEDGTQVLLVTLSASTLARLHFGADGMLISAEECEGKLLEGEPIAVSGGGEPESPKVVAAPIRVRIFSVPLYGVEILARPEVFEDFLANPEVEEPEEKYRVRTYQKVREWDEQNRFVLATPGNEYWMEGDGSVYAT